LAVVLILGCLCAAAFGLGSFLMIRSGPNEIPSFPVEIGLATPTGTPQVLRPTARATQTALPQAETDLPDSPSTPDAPPATEVPVQSDVPSDTLAALEDTTIPVNDLIDLARRLQGVENIPATLEPPGAFFRTGDEQTFWATNTETNESFQVQATLRYVTDHLYFWVQNGVSFNEGELRNLAVTFEETIYPTNRDFFGSEWTPGIDGDPHLYVLYARGLGSRIAGYFSSSDEVAPQAHEYSNGHEMFMLNADNVDLGEEFTYGVLAHEFQHMIHWYRDRNETSWLNEGFSELAAFLNGYDVGGFDFAYTDDPDLQLNDWPNDSSATTPHYGASFLFLTYFLDRFGDEATQALVSHDDNGMSSIDAVLQELAIRDPLSGQAISADDVFQDWVIASFLQDRSVGDGRFTYSNYAGAPQPGETESIDFCPTGDLTRDVRQFGVDYVQITCEGETTLRFEGSTVASVVPADPHSGAYAFWSNKGDESDMTLTQTFDFTGQSGPLTFYYWTWYDLEEDYDYLYLEASVDGDQWTILNTPSGTGEDPSGNSYGWGYNGLSGGGPQWIREKVDLSEFAGQTVQLRFEYITDAAVNGEGFLLDDVEIPEIGYSTDFESDAGGWEAAGFVRIQNLLPQTYRLALISRGRETTVEYIPLQADMTAEIPLRIGDGVEEVILVVSGTTRYTRQPTAYRIMIGE
jgi:hypothetical protein